MTHEKNDTEKLFKKQLMTAVYTIIGLHCEYLKLYILPSHQSESWVIEVTNGRLCLTRFLVFHTAICKYVWIHQHTDQSSTITE